MNESKFIENINYLDGTNAVDDLAIVNSIPGTNAVDDLAIVNSIPGTNAVDDVAIVNSIPGTNAVGSFKDDKPYVEEHVEEHVKEHVKEHAKEQTTNNLKQIKVHSHYKGCVGKDDARLIFNKFLDIPKIILILLNQLI